MPTNIEIKAALRDPHRVAELARGLADTRPQVLRQDDTFFRVPRGRLKLREFEDASPAELIFYHRADAAGPKASDYSIYRTGDPSALRAMLGAALGEIGRVRKTRTLLLAGRTRIHLDEVQNLGHFLELEVVLADGDDPGEGEQEAERLMTALEIRPDDLVEGAYLDLLAASSD